MNKIAPWDLKLCFPLENCQNFMFFARFSQQEKKFDE